MQRHNYVHCLCLRNVLVVIINLLECGYSHFSKIVSRKSCSTPLEASGDNPYFNYVLISDNVLSGDAHVWAMNAISEHVGGSLAYECQ